MNAHLLPILSFTLLNNNKIIIVQLIQKMKIIKKINEKNYKLLQILNKHISFMNKVIEIKENELISFQWIILLKF